NYQQLKALKGRRQFQVPNCRRPFGAILSYFSLPGACAPGYMPPPLRGYCKYPFRFTLHPRRGPVFQRLSILPNPLPPGSEILLDAGRLEVHLAAHLVDVPAGERGERPRLLVEPPRQLAAVGGGLGAAVGSLPRV